MINIAAINISSLKELAVGFTIILAIVFYIYASFQATLYDDAKKAIDNKHLSFRSIQSTFGYRFTFGLPIPIFSKPENDEIRSYKRKYNWIIIKFWLMAILAVIAYQI